MTVGIQLVSFNKPNKHQLAFNHNTRVIIRPLKWVHIKFQKSASFLLFEKFTFFFNDIILFHSNQKVKENTILMIEKIKEEGNTHNVSLFANCQSRITDRAEKEKLPLRHMKQT